MAKKNNKKQTAKPKVVVKPPDSIPVKFNEHLKDKKKGK